MSLLDDFFNHKCLVCSPGGQFPGTVFPFPVVPISQQTKSKRKKTKYVFKIRNHIKRNNWRIILTHSGKTAAVNDLSFISNDLRVKKVCLGVLFLLKPKDRDKDVDNMCKAFLDAIKGNHGLITDDMEVVHLSCFKVINDNGQEFRFPTYARNPNRAYIGSDSGIFLRIIPANNILVI